MKPSPLNRGLTLIEVLVVLGLVAMLASMVAVVIVQVRHFSYQVECQENLRQIGQTVNQIALSNGGKYPLYEEEVEYESAPGTYYYIPWWVKVFRQWEGSRDLLDMDPTAEGIQLPLQVPTEMKSFSCRMAGPLTPMPSTDDVERMRNWTRSLSYGLNVDVKLDDDDATPYVCVANDDPLYPALQNPPETVEDRAPDVYYITEIKTPSKFILLSEADTQDPNPANWTGGRIASAYINGDVTSAGPATLQDFSKTWTVDEWAGGVVWITDGTGFSQQIRIVSNTATQLTLEEPWRVVPDGTSRYRILTARIVGRHNGRANVLFADMHVDTVDVKPEGTWTGNINLNFPYWTLPDD